MTTLQENLSNSLEFRRFMAWSDFTNGPFASVSRSSSNRPTIRTTLGIQWLSSRSVSMYFFRVAITLVSQTALRGFPTPGVSISFKFRWEWKFVLNSWIEFVPSTGETLAISRWLKRQFIWRENSSLNNYSDNFVLVFFLYRCRFATIGRSKHQNVCIIRAVRMSWVRSLKK